MPLARYGVAIGTFVSFQRDPQDQFGHWYHGHLTIATPAGNYASALDVDTPSGVGVSYRLSPALRTSDLAASNLAPGWHPLTPTDASGAIDYIRSPMLQDRVVRWPLFPAGIGPKRWWLERLLLGLGRAAQITGRRVSLRPWVASTGDNALSALEAALPGSTRIYLFGEHYADGTNGVHDVHMNQGDPIGSPFAASNGIWQDGAVFAEHAGGGLFGWQVRFNTQSLHTDDMGRPL
jgi:Uncharacterized conserved protein (DUF2278)